MRSFPTQSNFGTALFILLFITYLTGCGSGTQAAPPPSQTYPFQSASSYAWLQQFGANNLLAAPSGEPTTFPTQVITGLAADATGNVIAAGYDLGEFAGASNPNRVAENFVAKFDMDGKQAWVQQWGTGSGDFLNSVAGDAAGNIYAVGTTHGALDGASNPSRQVEGTLSKLGPDGSLLWERQFTVDDAYTYPSGIAVSSDGSVTIGGDYSASGAPSTALLFVEKLDGSSGVTVWQKTFGTTAVDFLDSLASDSNGDIYAAVETTGPFPGQSTGQHYSYLMKLTGATGTQAWTQVLSEPNLSIVVPFGLTVSSESVIVGGAASNVGVTIGSSSEPTEEGFLSSFNAADGSVRWNKLVSTSFGEEITGVAVSTAGNIYAVGETNGLFASGFDQPNDNMMVLKFASDGTSLTAAQFGTGPIINQDAGAGPLITASQDGQIYVGGPVQKPFPGFTNPGNELQLFVSRFSQ